VVEPVETTAQHKEVSTSSTSGLKPLPTKTTRPVLQPAETTT
jgi:hypothetical protein